jgi:hypothetical protein
MNAIFWNVTLRSPVEIRPRPGETCCLHPQGRRVNQAKEQESSGKPGEPREGGKRD